MIRGYKPNGYTLSFTADGKRVEAETRQCVHCQFTWSYGEEHPPDEFGGVLAHPTRRGYCVKCQGWVCARAICIQRQIDLTGNSSDCIPYQDQVDRMWDKVSKYFPLSPELTITPSGLIIPRMDNAG